MPFLSLLKFRTQTFHLEIAFLLLADKLLKRTTSAAQQEKPREILEQISGIPGLRSIVDNFDIAVESWLGRNGIQILTRGRTKDVFWVVVSNIFYFHRYLGKIPILTNFFQMG